MAHATVAPSPLVADYEAVRSRHGREPRSLAELRDRAMRRFREVGFPTPRLEAWRFTNVRSIAETPYEVVRGSQLTPTVEPFAIAGAHRLVVVDGRFSRELSAIDGLPPGTVLTSLADAIERCPELVEPDLGRLGSIDDHPFAALNTALFEDGAFVWLPAGSVVDRPIQLLFIATPHGRPVAMFPRTLVVAGRASSATVIETYAGTDGDYLVCPVSEYLLQDGAVIDHYKLQEEAPAAGHVALQSAAMAASSSFRSSSVSLGGALVRNDVTALLDGAGADVTLDGLYLTAASQHVDNHLLVRHAQPHGTSRQLYKGILQDTSRAVFNGTIVVDRDAQRTNAEQANRNLLLSNGALVNSNPQLEILADDVRCTHGSTVGRLDEDAVFYLRSRGLDRAAAEGLLTYAFAAEVIDRIHIDDVRQRLDELLAARLPAGAVVREAT